MIKYVLVYARAVEPDFDDYPLILKKRPDYLKGMLNLPGGKIEEGETAIDAAIRELREETGLEPISESDPMVPLEPVLNGRIIGDTCTIDCVTVPITFRQEFKPRSGEDEEVGWFPKNISLYDPRLMPNLRLVIPLMEAGLTGWTVEDKDGDWTQYLHTIFLSLSDENWFPIEVQVLGTGYDWDSFEDSPQTKESLISGICKR